MEGRIYINPNNQQNWWIVLFIPFAPKRMVDLCAAAPNLPNKPALNRQKGYLT